MKETSIGQRLNAWLPAVVFAALIAVTAGCGDSTIIAGVGTGGTGTVSGKVADGYLANASLFLDKNGNYVLDAGEPFTSTDANGAYTLNIQLADVGRYPVVALATKGVTIDRDTNLPVENSFVLSLHKDSVSGTVGTNLVSPLTSLLREAMETGIYSTMQQAMDALRTKMGLPAGTDLMSDYIAANNSGMHTAAQRSATLMGNQADLVFVTGGSSTIVDVNRYRGMMGMIFTNMSSVMGANTQAEMTNLSTTMTTMMSGIPPMISGQPYQNMSSAYRGTKWGMVAGTSLKSSR
jgi:hypothetical protein